MPRNELVALGMLVALVILAALFPWSRLIPERVPGPSKDYPFANMRFNKPPAPHPGRDLWRMSVKYPPGGGKLQVTLTHKYDLPASGFAVVAEFSRDGILPPTVGVWLQEQTGGAYASETLNLDKGTWYMSVLGRRQAEPVFRLEQVLNVE